ncbi:hypothetical protein HG531_008729 [Fusarium graminearum]|nr:hypothetical protein HG531_008729 [Fusarium graminearum]
MPLDTSTYSLALLRVDGRRWNELRRLHAQIRTQDAADGSSYLEMGHTKVMCVVTGPSEQQQRRGGQQAGRDMAAINVNVVVAGFSSVDRKKRGRNDKRIQEIETTIANALSSNLHTHLFPNSSISISLHVLSQDGSLLAALINATTLALIDAGIPMSDYIAACTAGSTSTYAAGDDNADPLLDLNNQEEQELPFLTVATHGDTDRVAVLVCESRVQVSRLEVAAGVDSNQVDLVVESKGLGESGGGVAVAGDGDERDSVAASVDVLGVKVGERLYSLLASFTRSEEKDTGVGLGSKTLLGELLQALDSRDRNNGGDRLSSGALGVVLLRLGVLGVILLALGALGIARSVDRVRLSGLGEELDHVLLGHLTIVDNMILALTGDKDKSRELLDAELLDSTRFLITDLAHRDYIEEVNGNASNERTGSSLLSKQNSLGLVTCKERVKILITHTSNVVVDLAHNSLLDSTGSSLALVILYDGLTRLLARADNLESGKALDTHGTAKLLVGVIVTVNGSNLSETIEVLSSFLVSRLQVLTVTTPRSVELDNLEDLDFAMILS